MRFYEKQLEVFAELLSLRDDLQSATKEARLLRSDNDNLRIAELITIFKSIESKAMNLKTETLRSYKAGVIALFSGAALIGISVGFFSAYLSSEELFLNDLRHSQVAALEQDFFDLRNAAGDELLLINQLRGQGIVISKNYILVPNKVVSSNGITEKGDMLLIKIKAG